MKSKISFFNRTIFKKNITQYWPVWSIYLFFLLLFWPFNIWQMMNVTYDLEASHESLSYYSIFGAVSIGTEPVIIAIAAVVVAAFLFSYLYTARNTNMIHALPVTRFELFVTNYLSGLVFLIGSQTIAFLVGVLVCVGLKITCIQYLFYGFVYAAGMAFFFYSLAVFVAMFTGNRMALLAYYFIINILYVGVVYLLASFQAMVCYGQVETISPGRLAVLSPLVYLERYVSVSVNHDEMGQVFGIYMNGGFEIGMYAIAAIFFAVAACLLYRKRNLETAGDLVSIGVIKPIFRWGVALCGGFFISMFIVSAIGDVTSINSLYLAFAISIAVTGTICFFIAQMMIEKNFRVFKKKRIVECASLCGICFLVLLLFKLDVFGVVEYQPDAEDIEKAFVYLNYPLAVDGEDIPDLLEIQKEVIEKRDEYLTNQANGNSYFTTFRYYLKDGSTYTRRYPVACSPQYLEDKNSPVSRLLVYETDAERLKKKILGPCYNDRSRYYDGTIEVYDENGDYNTLHIAEEKLGKLMDAIERDIEEGNFDRDYISGVTREEVVRYINNICLYYYIKSDQDNFGDLDYYSDYWEIKNNTIGEYASSPETYITLTEDCVHTIEVLAQLGLTDETWKLVTDLEFTEQQGKEIYVD